MRGKCEHMACGGPRACKRGGGGGPCKRAASFPAHLLDPVAAGHHQGGQGRGGQGRGDGVALLGDVHLAVPPAPDLGRREHAASAALVAESSLSSPVGSTSRHTGNTRDGASSSPRLGSGLVAGSASLLVHVDGVRLALVLGHVGVDAPHDIGPALAVQGRRG
jgi:hypothetical protein